MAVHSLELHSTHSIDANFGKHHIWQTPQIKNIECIKILNLIQQLIAKIDIGVPS